MSRTLREIIPDVRAFKIQKHSDKQRGLDLLEELEQAIIPDNAEQEKIITKYFSGTYSHRKLIDGTLADALLSELHLAAQNAYYKKYGEDTS